MSQQDTKMNTNISLTRQLPASLRGLPVAACLADAMCASIANPGQLWHEDERDDGGMTLAGCGQR
jgi:hypothetical protein